MITVRSNEAITRIYKAAELVHKTAANPSSVPNHIYNWNYGNLNLTNDNGVITAKVKINHDVVVVFECAWRNQLQCYAATIFRPGEWVMRLNIESQKIVDERMNGQARKEILHRLRFEPIDDREALDIPKPF